MIRLLRKSGKWCAALAACFAILSSCAGATASLDANPDPGIPGGVFAPRLDPQEEISRRDGSAGIPAALLSRPTCTATLAVSRRRHADAFTELPSRFAESLASARRANPLEEPILTPRFLWANVRLSRAPPAHTTLA